MLRSRCDAALLCTLWLGEHAQSLRAREPAPTIVESEEDVGLQD